MASRFTFTIHPTQNISANPAAARDFKRATKLLNGDFPPESLWIQANRALTEKARALSFSTHRPYVTCMREILRCEPELKLGVGPYVRDIERPEFVFVDAEADGDDE